MSSDVDMSLEEIIKKKGTKNRNAKRGLHRRQFTPSVRPKIDARNKIISKKRTQIIDAREILAGLAKHKDARFKLEQLRTKKMELNHSIGRKLDLRTKFNHDGLLSRSAPNILFADPSRQVSSQSYLPSTKIHINKQKNINMKKGFIESRFMGSRSFDYDAPLKPILRTVENDIIMIDQDEDEYGPPTFMTNFNREASLNLKITTHNTGLKRHLTREKEKSPPRPPSILKKRPMAAFKNEKKSDVFETSEPSEYRIIVSNLRNTVTASDIQELFGDIGGLKESRLVRSGTAEVIYKKLDDAQKAVDLYHNRQLDGQPMNCLLVNPRSTNNPARGNGLPSSSSSNVEPDLSTFHKVLFSTM